MEPPPWEINPWLYGFQTLVIYSIIILPGTIHTRWRLILFHIIFNALEIGVQGNITGPSLCTITNSFLILARVSYYRVIHHNTEFFGGAFGFEFSLWRRFGRRTDENLQQNLGRRLKTQQSERRLAKWQPKLDQERAAAVADAAGRLQELEAKNAKYERLTARCGLAFEGCQRFPPPERERGDGAVSTTMRGVDIDKRAGKEILRWLAAEIKVSEGFIKPVKWSKDKRTGAITCNNGYADENIPIDYFANPDDLIIGSVSVTEPSQIAPALSLIETALDHIRFYDINNFPGYDVKPLHPSHTQFRRAVAVSCEMKRYAPEFIKGQFGILDVDDPNWDNARRKGTVEYVEKDRELVSLLTVSVDRYLTVTFHIAYMLQYATALNTRIGLQLLFQDLILNRRKIKIWKDTPRSIAALDATLEHIFRGSGGADQPEGPGRQRYLASLRKPFRDDGPTDILRAPGYKDIGPDEFLRHNRPADTEFRRGLAGGPPCPLQLHGPGVDYADRTCPCDKGIIDISALVDFILRQHRFMGIDTVTPHALRPWAAPHPHSDLPFGDLVRWLLAGHKWQPFLGRFKETKCIKLQKPNTHGLQLQEAQEFINIYNMKYNMHKIEHDKLFTTDGETRGIERDDMCLSYVVCEAIGLGLILRNLLTCESPILMGERLSHYAYKNTLKVPSCAYDTVLFRKPVAPTVLRPLVLIDSFTLGLEADEPESVYGARSIPAWETLASNPAWFLKQSTHGKVGEEQTYSNVISNAFILTGWEHPVPPQVHDPRMPSPKRFGMITPPGMTAKLREAIVADVAEVDRENLAARQCAFEVVDKALETNFLAEMADEFALRMERAMALLGGSRSNVPTPLVGIHEEAVERGVGVDRLTRQARFAARTTRASARLLYDLRTTTANLLALILNGSIVPLPKTRAQAVARVTAGQAIRQMADEAITRARESESASRTAYKYAVELEATTRSMFPDAYLTDPTADIEALEAEKRNYMTGVQAAETVRMMLSISSTIAHANANSRIEIPASHSNPAIEKPAGVERARLAQNLANSATDLRDAIIAESRLKATILAGVNTAITHLEELDTILDEEQSGLNGTRRRRPGEKARVRERLPIVQRTVDEDRRIFTPQRLAEIRTALTRAQRPFEDARATLEVEKAREAAGGVRTVTNARERLRVATIEVAFRQAAMDTVPSPQHEGNLATAQRALRTAQNLYDDALGAVHIDRGNAMAALRETRIALEGVYLGYVDGVYNALDDFNNRAAPAILRDFEPPEEHAAVNMAIEMLTLVTAMDANVNVLRGMVDKMVIQSAKLERATRRAKQSIIQQEAFVIRLPTLRAGRLIVDGNFGLALTVRNLVARTFRVSHKLMPKRYAAFLLQAPNNLNNVTWYEMFSDLFRWHCGLEDRAVPPNNPAVTPNDSEITVREEFLRRVTARVPDDVERPVPLRERQKFDLHDYVSLVCGEVLIFMLVREISRFEELDTARRLVLGVDRAASDYKLAVGHSLWESVTMLQLKHVHQLDSFTYQDAHWFKRLQVLLGYEFGQGISIQSPSSRIIKECGAKDMHGLVEMLVSEVERFLKIYMYQGEVVEYIERMVNNSNLFPRRRLGVSATSNAIKRTKPLPRCDRRSPLYKFEKNIARPSHISDAAALAAARTKLAAWRIPGWLSYLLLRQSKIDYTGSTISGLFTEYHPPPLPNPSMSHVSWIRTFISLITADPEIELESWDGLRKWWRNGAYIQGIGLADEHVEQALLPDLDVVMGDGGRVPGVVPPRIVQSRRVHNATHRAFVNMSQLADIAIDRFPGGRY